jgi:hypothetical protein
VQRPKVGRQPIRAVLVELDEVAGGIAHIELHDIARQLDEAVSEGGVVEGVAPLRGTVDRLQVVDGDGEMVCGCMHGHFRTLAVASGRLRSSASHSRALPCRQRASAPVASGR